MPVVHRTAVIAVVVALLAACEGDLGGRSGTPSPQAPPETPTTLPAEPEDPATPEPQQRVTITEDDDGEHVILAVDGVGTLRLGGEADWSLLDIDGEALEFIPVDFIQDPGYDEWELRPTARGRVRVTAVAQPAGCVGDCPEQDRVVVTIEVRER